jgi:hypothetical protein
VDGDRDNRLKIGNRREPISRSLASNSRPTILRLSIGSPRSNGLAVNAMSTDQAGMRHLVSRMLKALTVQRRRKSNPLNRGADFRFLVMPCCIAVALHADRYHRPIQAVVDMD